VCVSVCGCFVVPLCVCVCTEENYSNLYYVTVSLLTIDYLYCKESTSCTTAKITGMTTRISLGRSNTESMKITVPTVDDSESP
jgi:hypothetical protein